MSLYGHTMIDVESLKRWVNSLEVKENSEVDIAGCKMKVDYSAKQVLEMQLQCFSNAINQMKEGDDWRNYQGILSPIFYNTFIRLDNSSLRMGDYYECLIRPSNIKTYKKIIKGFDYKDIGAIHIKDENEKPIASIGCKSDLIWTVFFEYFVNENEDGSIDHVYGNHENIMSIQLFGVENYSIEALKARVNEIFLHVSMKYDMDFGVFELDPRLKEEGSDTIITDEYTPIGLEEIPMFYLTNAISASDERNKFLSFYQVIEYFFVRAQNYYFLIELSNINLSSVNHNELSKILAEHKKISAERESLKLVLKKL